jgi:hypothetical protein
MVTGERRPPAGKTVAKLLEKGVYLRRGYLHIAHTGLDQLLLEQLVSDLLPVAPSQFGQGEALGGQLLVEILGGGKLTLDARKMRLQFPLDFSIGDADGGVALGLDEHEPVGHHLIEEIAPHLVALRRIRQVHALLRRGDHQLRFEFGFENDVAAHHGHDAVEDVGPGGTARQQEDLCRGPKQARGSVSPRKPRLAFLLVLGLVDGAARACSSTSTRVRPASP